METGDIEFYPIRSKKPSFHRGFNRIYVSMNATITGTS
jgi:hypothetical protein